MASEKETEERVSPIVDRSVRLFHFLRELVAARLAAIRDVADYEDVIWLSEIPHESGWYCSAWNVNPAERAQIGEEVWLRATKPRIAPPPKFPSVLNKWLNESEIADFKREELPSLQAEIFETIKEKNELGELVERVVSHRLEDYPNVIEAHREWGDKFWRPWAAESLKLQPIQEVYGKLFALYQKQKRLGESYEVVIGLGLFTWKPEGQSPIRRHLVTAQTELAFEGGRGVLTVTAAADGAKLLLEQDMLDVKHRPGNDQDIAEQLKTIDENWWDQNQIEPVLRSWINFFASDGQYHHLIDRQASGADIPAVHFAPALILRKRTARTLIHVFDSIAKQLKDSKEADVPVGVKSIVTTLSPGSSEEKCEDSGNGHITGDGEIYFPLPYNEQQRRIVDKYNTNHGVVVQGPPGTGKSQTIANLICHLLASGKRVLITSHTARALQSLSDKIPEEVQALCVSLLGNDRKAYEGLEESIVGITNRYNSWDRAVNQRLIEETRERLHEARMQQARATANLRTLREAEVTQHQAPYGDYQGKLSEIAKRLAEEEARFGWATEYVTEKMQSGSPAELLELRELLIREADFKARSVENLTLEISSIPTPEQFADLVDTEARAHSLSSELNELRSRRDFEILRKLPTEKFKAIGGKSRQIKSRLSKAKTHIHPWAAQVFTEVLGEKDRAWRTLLQQTETALETIRASAERAERLRVTSLGEANITAALSDCQTLVKHLEDGGKLRGIFGRPKALKNCSYLLEQVQVEGKQVSGIEEAQKLLEWLEVRKELESLQLLWAKLSETKIDSLLSAIAEFEDLCEPLKEAIELHATMTGVREELIQIGGMDLPVWYDSSEMERFCHLLEAVELDGCHADATAKVAQVNKAITQVFEGRLRPSVVERLLTAISKRDNFHYRLIYFEIDEIIAVNKQLRRLSELEAKFRVDAPTLLENLRRSPADSVWETRLANFDAA